VQDLALGFVEFCEVDIGPLLKPVKVPLDGIPSLRCVDCSTQLCIMHKVAEGALNPNMSLIKILNSISPSMDS